MKIVRVKPVGDPWQDVVVDIRVDDHRRPLKELRRLYRKQMAYVARSFSEKAISKGEWEKGEHYFQRALKLDPRNKEFVFWYVVGLAKDGRLEQARKLWRRHLSRRSKWLRMLKRLPGSSVLPSKAEGELVLKNILGEKKRRRRRR